MSSAPCVIFTCILISCTGFTTAEDSSLSDSSIVALSVLIGLILILSVLCTVCYCSRKYRVEQRRKKLQSLQSLKTSDVNVTEVQNTTTVTESTKPQTYKNRNRLIKKVESVHDYSKEIDYNTQSCWNSASQRGLETIKETNKNVEETVKVEKLNLSETSIDEATHGVVSKSIGDDDIERQVIDSIYKNLLEDKGKLFQDSINNNLLDEKVELSEEPLSDKEIPEQFSETTAESPKMVVVQNNTVYRQSTGRGVHTVYTQGGSSPQLQKFSEWNAKTAPPTNLYVKNVNAMNRNHYTDMRPRTRSISPTRYQQRANERGRTVKRIAVPSQMVLTQNPSTTLRVSTANRARVRSRSAPPLRETAYVTRVPQQHTTGYTQSHFLAIKQPFSKKYLLPPVRVSQRFVPTGSQRVVVNRRPTVVTRPEPQQVIKGNVYHVQYQPDRSNTITRGVNALNLERSTKQTVYQSGQVHHNGNVYQNGQRQNVTRQYSNGSQGPQGHVYQSDQAYHSGQVYHSGQQQQYMTRQYSNGSQGYQGQQAVYNSQLSYASDVFDKQGMYVRNEPGTNEYFVTSDTRKLNSHAYQTQPIHFGVHSKPSLSEYQPKIMKTSFYEKKAQGGWTFAETGSSSRPTSQVYESKSTTVTATTNGNGDYVYSQVRSDLTENKVEVQTNGNADEYTIVDYVENEPSASNKRPLSTSTPRFPERDTSALDDLDDVLGKSGSSSSSSSPSSSDNEH